VSAITADRGTDGHQSVSVADHQPIQHGEFQDGHDRQHERDSPSHTGSGTGEHKKLSAQSTDSTGATHTAGDRDTRVPLALASIERAQQTESRQRYVLEDDVAVREEPRETPIGGCLGVPATTGS